MARVLGNVTKSDNGAFEGMLTMGINSQIRIAPNEAKDSDNHPDYRIFSRRFGEIGAGWNNIARSSGNRYVALSMAHPALGPHEIRANLGRVTDGAENEFVILWNAK